jgi:hypothetical protein
MLSAYDPRDFFSQDPQRTAKALRALLATPNVSARNADLRLMNKTVQFLGDEAEYREEMRAMEGCSLHSIRHVKNSA